MRLLLYYFAVVGVALLLTHRLVQKLRVSVMVFVAVLPVLFLAEAFATSDIYAPLDIAYHWEPLASYRTQYGIRKQRTPILVDVVDEQIPWQKAVRDAVKNGRLPLWNRFQFAGEPLLAVQMSAVLYPGTWLGFGLPLAQAWTFNMGLRIFLALLGAVLLLRDMGRSSVAACFGATSWALCDFLIFTIGYPLGAAAGLLPLLVLGLRRIALTRGAEGRGVTIAAVALIIAAGHPETTLHAIAFAGVFFLTLVATQPAGTRVQAVKHALVSGVLGVSLMAVSLGAFVEVLPHTFEYRIRKEYFATTHKSVPVQKSLAALENQVVPYSNGVSGTSAVTEHYEASGYGGSLALVFATIGLAVRTKDRLPTAVAAAVGLAVAIGLRGIADVVGKLPLFDIAINQRLIVTGAFALSVFGAVGLDAVLHDGRWRRVAVAAAALGLLIFGVWVERRPSMTALNMPSDYMSWRLALELLPLVGLLVLAWYRPMQRRFTCWVWLLPVVLAAIRYLEIGRLYPVIPSKAFYPPLDVLQPIDRHRPDRFAAFGFTFIPNMAALYELEDVRAYEAMTLDRLVATFPLWCTLQPVWFNRIDDPTKSFLSFLNVRYFLAPPDYGAPAGWHPVTTGKGGVLLENERVLQRAFIPHRVFCTDDPREQLATLGTIQDFSEAGVASGCSTPRWLENAAARSQITSYQADGLAVDVLNSAPTLLATSITAWPGWRVTVDGRAVTPVFYNYAFLGVQLGSGHHSVGFRYRPRGAYLGGVITCLTIAAVAFLHARRHRGES